MTQDRLQELEAEAVADPDSPGPWCGLAAYYLAGGSIDAGEQAVRMALRALPEDSRALCLHGRIHLLRGQTHEAHEALTASLRVDPGQPDAWSHLGHVMRTQRRLEEAISCHRNARRLAPGEPVHRWNLALGLLMAGQWEEGWAEYQGRHLLADWPRPPVWDGPNWDGAPDPETTVLVWAEQGLGDTIQFVRWLAALRQRVGRVELLCPRPLGVLLQGVAGIDGIVHRPIDATPGARLVPLLSLPALVGPAEPPPVRADAPLLRASLDAVSQAGLALALGRGLRVAVGFQGNPAYPTDAARSVPLAEFEALAGPGVRLLSVQKVHGLEQIQERPELVEDWGARLELQGPPFVETAGFLAQVDLVVTSDTALAHLAASLGRPTWVLLPFVPDWRWGMEGQASPWYGSVRLFRQQQRGDWTGVMRKVRAALDDVMQGRTLP